MTACAPKTNKQTQGLKTNIYSQARWDLMMQRDKQMIATYKANIKPTRQPRYDESDGSLPSGWRIERVPRQSSNHFDLYWYSKTNKKMRSRVEVGLFMELLTECNFDEEEAWKMFPASRKSKQYSRSK